jgi:hypothetical protein
MPNLFVVTDQSNLTLLAAHVLRSRVSTADRNSALEAMARANPHLDFDRLTPGTVVVIPDDAPGLKKAISDDPAGEAADDLVGRVTEAVTALVDGSELAERTRREEQKEEGAIAQDASVKRLAKEDKQLAANLDGLLRSFESDDVAAKEDRASLKAAAASWQEDLQALRSLL